MTHLQISDVSAPFHLQGSWLKRSQAVKPFRRLRTMYSVLAFSAFPSFTPKSILAQSL